MTRHTLHVPSRLNDGAPVDPDYFDWIADTLVNLAGGFTLTTAVGAWRSEDGTRYSEDVRLYAVDSEDVSLSTSLRYLARTIAQDLRQEAVYVTEAPIVAHLVTPTYVTA